MSLTKKGLIRFSRKSSDAPPFKSELGAIGSGVTFIPQRASRLRLSGMAFAQRGDERNRHPDLFQRPLRQGVPAGVVTSCLVRVAAVLPPALRQMEIEKLPGADVKSLAGASAINCWRPNRNMCAWYSLRLNSRLLFLLSKVSGSNEESQLPKQGMPACANSRGWKHHPPRLLQD